MTRSTGMSTGAHGRDDLLETTPVKANVIVLVSNEAASL